MSALKSTPTVLASRLRNQVKHLFCTLACIFFTLEPNTRFTSVSKDNIVELPMSTQETIGTAGRSPRPESRPVASRTTMPTDNRKAKALARPRHFQYTCEQKSDRTSFHDSLPRVQQDVQQFRAPFNYLVQDGNDVRPVVHNAVAQRRMRQDLSKIIRSRPQRPQRFPEIPKRRVQAVPQGHDTLALCHENLCRQSPVSWSYIGNTTPEG